MPDARLLMLTRTLGLLSCDSVGAQSCLVSPLPIFFILVEKERGRHGVKSLYSSRVIDIRSDIIGVDALIKIFHGEVDFSYSCCL